jgi:hypothetical protein
MASDAPIIAYAAANRERVRVKARAYYAANRDHIQAKARRSLLIRKMEQDG